MTPTQQEREYQTVWHLVAALSNICVAPPEMAIDQLTGYLWDETEAAKIKAAGASLLSK